MAYARILLLALEILGRIGSVVMPFLAGWLITPHRAPDDECLSVHPQT